MKTRFATFAFIFTLSTSTAFAGTVTGKANFTGTPPVMEAINMDADPVCAGLHAEPLKSEEVVLNADNTLKNVFVYVKQGLEGKTFEPATEPAVMDQRGCHYEPHVFGVQVKQPLEIVNSDTTLHNVHGMPTASKEFNLGMPIAGMKLKRTFDAPEVMVKFKCDVHPWMNAYAGVLPHSFYSVTGDAGTFEIKDLPPGTYVLEAWHEKYGTQIANVTITGDETQTADFTFPSQ